MLLFSGGRAVCDVLFLVEVKRCFIWGAFVVWYWTSTDLRCFEAGVFGVWWNFERKEIKVVEHIWFVNFVCCALNGITAVQFLFRFLWFNYCVHVVIANGQTTVHNSCVYDCNTIAFSPITLLIDKWPHAYSLEVMRHWKKRKCVCFPWLSLVLVWEIIFFFLKITPIDLRFKLPF